MNRIPIHSIANAFHWIGMDTIAMDTYPSIAPVAGAATDVVTNQDPALSSSSGRRTLEMSDIPARRGQANDGEEGHRTPSCARPFGAR